MPAKYNGNDITEIVDGGLEEAYIRTIVIPKSITKIGEYAFNESVDFDARNLIVYYQGDESDWGKITIEAGNDELKNAKIYYYSKTQKEGCWHWGDGDQPALWP